MEKPRRPNRRHVKVENDPFRSPYQRDRDRVLYSSAFRRLSGVAQVAAVNEQRVLHNRLTHSLKVAQLGRRLVQQLKHDEPAEAREIRKLAGIKADVVETAGLIHDIGHPPFGHIAEPVLDACLRRVDGLEGFEGNAQSFRIVTKLARRRTEHPGLDLTRATLDAMLKYPRPRPMSVDDPFAAPPWTDRGFGSKWGTYASELTDFRWARTGARAGLRSANAILMDWADDITYATHDIEDYFRAGLIPLHDLRRDRARIAKHAHRRLDGMADFEPAEFDAALSNVITKFTQGITSSCWDTRQNRSAMNAITTRNLTECVGAVSLVTEPPYVTVDPHCQYLVEALKELTWFYVIDRPSLAVMQKGQKHIVQSLYDRLRDCLADSPKSPRLPIQLRSIYQGLGQDADFMSTYPRSSEAREAKAVVDYICVLTEAQAIDLDERLGGRSHGSMFGAWFS
ncbi:dNTP triphosphohydrolase [Amycolatopsis mongoliensis]|uniref:DNTP triphosphohydrolase n=1 Tax=Amycolatopsis mongoliensis TaxID=715475 RepID=A0A9Y2NJG2_9PSEU|nr:dNTP triphosphohydrolase [Amycolatopsis sp. 4-36]WIY01758.1 dNTP triphosphohydrolase [Amycolatopsis sp. 4-36]